MMSRNFTIFLLIISVFKFTQSAVDFCAEPTNNGRIKWHEDNCNFYYRCWNGLPLQLQCPIVAQYFDSCRLQCVNDPNTICGDPGDRCIMIPTTTTPGDNTTEDPSQTTLPTAPTVRPTAPTVQPIEDKELEY